MSPALNVQVIYYQKDDFTKPYTKIIWINLKAKSEADQNALAERLGKAIAVYPNGGDGFLKIVNLIIDQEVKKDCLLKDERTDYEWKPDQPKDRKTWPKDEAMPPIPPEGDIEKIEKLLPKKP